MSVFRAAIVDDGAAANIFDTANCIAIDESGIYKTEEFNDEYSHGSYCMHIIKKYSDISDIEWFNINIFCSEECGTISSFLKALEFCLKNEIKLIHLSLGTRDFRYFTDIKQAIELLLNNGTIIVASLSNEDEYTVPACLNGVIGVKWSEEFKNNRYGFIENNPEGIEFCASGSHILNINGRKERCKMSSSFATSVITAEVIKIIKENNDVKTDEVVEKLRVAAEKSYISGVCRINGEDKLNVPVILVKNNNKSEEIRIVNGLKDMFISCEYNAVCSCETDKIIKNIKSEQTLGMFLFVSGFYKCDVIIVDSSSPELIRGFRSYDVAVLDDEDVYRYLNEGTEVINTTNNADIDYIFRRIIDNLEE